MLWCSYTVQENTVFTFCLTLPLSNQLHRLGDENASFPAGSPRHVIRKKFDAPSKSLELSSAVKVKTHQFLSKSHCVLDLNVVGGGGGRGRRKTQTGPVGSGL